MSQEKSQEKTQESQEKTQETQAAETTTQAAAEADTTELNRDRLQMPARLRKMRSQLLRSAATLAEDPQAATAEGCLLRAAQELQAASVALEPARG